MSYAPMYLRPSTQPAERWHAATLLALCLCAVSMPPRETHAAIPQSPEWIRHHVDPSNNALVRQAGAAPVAWRSPNLGQQAIRSAANLTIRCRSKQASPPQTQGALGIIRCLTTSKRRVNLQKAYRIARCESGQPDPVGPYLVQVKNLLIQRGGGTGPAKPRQPSFTRKGAKSGRMFWKMRVAGALTAYLLFLHMGVHGRGRGCIAVPSSPFQDEGFLLCAAARPEEYPNHGN
jgi:hypothetical protein